MVQVGPQEFTTGLEESAEIDPKKLATGERMSLDCPHLEKRTVEATAHPVRLWASS
jgi:hypothetical protein